MICQVDTQTDGTFRLKFVTILVGLLDVILGAVGSCGDKNDIFFLVTVLVIFSLSLLHLTCSLLDVFKTNFTSRGMDFLFHMVGGVLIFIASVLVLSGTTSDSCRVMEKTSAATIGIFNAFIYLCICWILLQFLRRKDHQPSLPLYLFCGLSRAPVLTTEPEQNSTRVRRKSSPSIPTRLPKSRIDTQESMVVRSVTETPTPVEN